VPSKQKPWSEVWVGLDPDEVTEKFGDFPLVRFSEQVQEMAAGVGIDLVTGMTGEQLHNAVAGVITHEDSPLSSVAQFSYDEYLAERTSAGTTATNELNKLRNNMELDPEWRQSMKEFLHYTDSVSARFRGQLGGIPLSEQQQVVDKFQALRAGSSESMAAWDKIWTGRYAKTYGALDWVPPEPLSPVDAEGNQRPTAVTPYIRAISDGDSLTVSDRPNSGSMYQVRLLGVRSADFGSDDEGALADMNRLQDALNEAIVNGDTIWFVRDPDTFGSNTDMYGRMLAWLWIGDKPYYFPDDFRRHQTATGEGS